MTLSVLVVGYRHPDVLAACLRSVARHLPEAAVRVWENSGATDEALLRAAHPRVELTVSPVNLGFAAAVNRLAAESMGDLLLLNPDAELLGPLTATRAAIAEARVAAAAPLSEDTAPGTEPWDVAHRALTLPRALVAHSGYAPRLRGRRVSDRYATRPATAEGYLAGACLLLRREAWDELGPLDEEYFLYGEEADWQRRALAAGWQLRLADEVGVRHTGHGTVAGDPAAATRSSDLLRANVALNLERAGSVHRADAFLAGMSVLDRAQRSSRSARRDVVRHRTTTKPDVVISVNRLVFGGAERQHVALATELTDRGYPVTIACLQRFGPLIAEIPPAVRVVRQPWWAPLVDVGDGPAVLIGGDTNTEAGFGTLWRRGRRRRRWLVGAHLPPVPDAPTYSAGLARALRSADGFIALSPAHRREVSAHQDVARRWYVAPNGVPLPEPAWPSRRPRPARGPLRLAMLTRIVEHKNPHLLVAALAGLHEHDWQLDIFGDGPDRERLEALTPPELGDRVRWRGWSSGPDHALREADLLCLPSAAEAFPMSILEAMARRVPVMATSVCAVPDMLDHGRAGLLVDRPDVTAWQTALAQVLADPSPLATFAQAGFERMRANYTVAAMADAYESAIDDALARP